MTTTVDRLNAGAGAGAPTTSSTSGMMLGQDDFLKLMTTQLTTQDPFKPVENTEMIAQMAQFSSVAGIAEMNQSLAKMAEVLNTNRLTDAASWIGRSMLVESNVATPVANGVYAGEITLDKAAEEVSLDFVDATGTVIHTETLGAQDQGTVQFAWDGKNAAGETIADAPLKIVVNARSNGEAMTPKTATWTQIGGIQSPASGGATQLVTGLGLLTPDMAIRLS